MKRTTLDGVNGVFFTDKEFVSLQEKILAQKELINDLEKEVLK